MATTSNDLNISESGLVSFDGTSVFHGRTIEVAGALTISNANGVSGNPLITSTASATDLHTARYIVASSTAGTGANYTSIQSAIDAAVGVGIPATVFLQPGTYTENLTLRPNINIAAYTCDALTPNVTISGKCTFTQAGTVSISGIRLASNGAEFLSVTGSAASIVNLTNCYLTTAFDPGITFSSSDSGAKININYCSGTITAAATAFYNSTSAGGISFYCSNIGNSGSSTKASNNSAGTINYNHSNFSFSFSNTSTGNFSAANCSFDCAGVNSTVFTGAGSILNCYLSSATASAISALGIISCYNSIINSSNTNAITGEGTLNYSGLSFVGTSAKINTTTQSGGLLSGGQTQAPTVGFIGQRIESTATNVATTTAISKTITSIALTPGIWDVSAMAAAIATGGTSVMTYHECGISTTDNTITGSLGIERFAILAPAAALFTFLSSAVPSYRITLTVNKTYYLVVQNQYTSTTCPTNGRLSATRVG